MAEAFIHHQELPMWQERANRGEIVIAGMAWEDRGYRLLYTDTPRLAENLPQTQCSNGQSQSRPFPARPVKVMESAGQQQEGIVAAGGEPEERKSSNASAESSLGQTNDATSHVLGDDQAPPCPLAAPAPVVVIAPPETILVTCPDCQGQHPADQTCGICEKMAHIRDLARKNCLEYHLMKKGQRAEAEGNE